MKGGTLVLIGLGALLLLGMSKQPGNNTDPGTDPGTAQPQTLLQMWIERIKQTPEWYNLIVQKATAAGATIEQQLAHDAQWAIDQGWTL